MRATVTHGPDWKAFHDKINEEVPIEEVLGLVGVSLPPDTRGKGFKVKCPFHRDTDPSMHVYLETNSVHCFGSCSRSWNVIGLYADANKLDYTKAADELGERYGISPNGVQEFGELRRVRKIQERPEIGELPEPIPSQRAEFYHSKLQPDQYTWLETVRLLPRWLIDEVMIGHLPSDDFPIGYSIPVWGERIGELITIRYRRDDLLAERRKDEFTTSQIAWLDTHKYWGIKGRNDVYPFGLWWVKAWLASKSSRKYILLAEAEFDTLALMGFGFPAMTLTMGASEARWDEWKYLIDDFEYWVVAFDDDEAGQSATAAMQLRYPSKVKSVKWPEKRWWPKHEKTGDVTVYLKHRGPAEFEEMINASLNGHERRKCSVSKYWKGAKEISADYWNS